MNDELGYLIELDENDAPIRPISPKESVKPIKPLQSNNSWPGSLRGWGAITRKYDYESRN